MNDNLATWINREIEERGWSVRELARRAGISHTTISKVISDQRDATYEFCAAIARPLEKQPEEVFRIAGLLPQKRSLEVSSLLRGLIDVAAYLPDEDLEELTYIALGKQERIDKGQSSQPARSSGNVPDSELRYHTT